MNTRRGMAIPMVFAFIGILSITVIMLLRSDKQDRPVIFHNLKHLQMKYVAKGALQHARLKMRLLSTEAYDAAAYAIGKNPFFDHSAGYADFPGNWTQVYTGVTDNSSRGIGSIVTNPGPAFIAGSMVSIDPLNRDAVEDTDFDNNNDIWTNGDVPGGNPRLEDLFKVNIAPASAARFRTNLHLVRFYEDISTLDPFAGALPTLYEAIDLSQWINQGNVVNGASPVPSPPTNTGVFPNSQAAIQIVSGAIDPVTGVPDMFTASYFVDEMKVLSTRDANLYGQEAVSVSVQVNAVSQGTVTATSDQTDLSVTRFSGVAGTLTEQSVFKVSRTLN
jgi:hypothetical protein